MRRIEFLFFIVFFFLLVAVFALNIIAPGTITSPAHLAIDFASPPDAPQTWAVADWVPTKYRALFRWIVQGTFALFFTPNDANGFYWAFVFWSFVFFYADLIALYFFLRLLNFAEKFSFAGCLLFLISPPVLLAYKYPVYTREEPLAYLLILLGLIAIIQAKPVWIAILGFFAGLTRETTLILPLTYWLTAHDAWRKKILVMIPPIIAVVGVRVLLGYQTYDPFEGSRYNFETPLQSIAFLFMIFGFLWFAFALRLCKRWRDSNADPAWRMLIATAPIVTLLALGTHIAFARAREIRISYILFPWVIPLALDWFRANQDRLRAQIRNPIYRASVCAIFATLSIAIFAFHLTQPELMRLHLADFKNGFWLFLLSVHLTASVALFAPLPKSS
ncbi:MAG: hypothetical protein HZC40_12430 [Chloroflexi bacterium]|nr:hypothetical protein [Chloroflexota bacterium]